MRNFTISKFLYGADAIVSRRARVRRRTLLAFRAFHRVYTERCLVHTKFFAEKLTKRIREDPDSFVASAALSLAVELLNVSQLEAFLFSANKHLVRFYESRTVLLQ